jgi:hypothetical protein
MPRQRQLLFRLREGEVGVDDDAIKRALDSYYSNDTNFGFAKSPQDGEIEFPDGSSWFSCSNWARYTRRLEGKAAKLYGFDVEDNPGSLIAAECGGHDFAVVRDRFIVDGWIVSVAGYDRRAVFDLFAAADEAIVCELYGNPRYWLRKCRNQCEESDVDSESAEKRNRALHGVVPRSGGSP